MSSLARIMAATENDGAEEDDRAIPLRDYVPFVLHIMNEQKLSFRKLALKTGIQRSRLSDILKIDVGIRHRPSITMVELQTILHVLGVEFMQAVLGVEALRDLELFHDSRFASMFAMVSEVCKGLPTRLAQALNEVEGMDGTEIRREWATPLREGVVERVVREVSRTIARRATLDSFNDYRD